MTEVEVFPSREEIERLRLENDRLRGIIAWSALDCIYCGLALGDQGKCQSGFPGCARADDQICYDPNRVLDKVIGEGQ